MLFLDLSAFFPLLDEVVLLSSVAGVVALLLSFFDEGVEALDEDGSLVVALLLDFAAGVASELDLVELLDGLEAEVEELLLLPLEAVADGRAALAPAVAVGGVVGDTRDPALAEAEAAGDALTDAEADAAGEAVGLTVALGDALTEGEADATGEVVALTVAVGAAVAFVEAPEPDCVVIPWRPPPAPMPMFTPTEGCTP